jgi:hypothetical protein
VEDLLARLTPVDIVFLEGFRLTCYPKLELVQRERDPRLFALDDPLVLAVTAAGLSGRRCRSFRYRILSGWPTSCWRMLSIPGSR